MLKIRPQERGFSATVTGIPSRTEVVAVRGRLDDSLFNAIAQTGESAELAMRMAQIFGYDLDFYIDPRRGDTFCMLLEKRRYANGQTGVTEKSSPPNTTTPDANALPRSCRPTRLLQRRRQIAAKGLPSLAAEIRSPGDLPFQ
jgi:hypothetical protein